MKHQACENCGSTWFTMPKLTLTSAGAVADCPGGVVCADCGTQQLRTPSPAPVEDRVAAVAAATPGEWIVWRVYPKDQRATAHVAASQLRSRKIRALDQVGDVDAKATRRADGTIEVAVTPRRG